MSKTHWIENRESAVSWILGFAILIVYLSFPTKVYYWDGIGFAQEIEDAPGLNISLIHPNHLVYNSVGYVFYKLLRAVAGGGRTSEL